MHALKEEEKVSFGGLVGTGEAARMSTYVVVVGRKGVALDTVSFTFSLLSRRHGWNIVVLHAVIGEGKGVVTVLRGVLTMRIFVSAGID